jgi:hypothetical protein
MNEATNKLQLRSSEVRDVFDLSASDNAAAPSSRIRLAVLSENETSKISVTVEIE